LIKPHFIVQMPDTEDPKVVQARARTDFGLIPSIEQDGDFVNLASGNESFTLSNGISRSFGMRVTYTDSSELGPNPLHAPKIIEVTTVDGIDTIGLMLDQSTQNPRQSPVNSKWGKERVSLDLKELFFKIDTAPGEDMNPWILEAKIGSDIIKRELDTKISEDNYRTSNIEIFPLGYIDLLDNQPTITEGDDGNKFTGFFTATDLEPEDLFNLYNGDNPFTTDFTDKFKTQALNSDKIKVITDDIYYGPIDGDKAKVHFGIIADPGITAGDLNDDLDEFIEINDADGDLIANVDQFEIASDRDFLVEVTTDVDDAEIKKILEDEPGSDFKNVANFREEENGKKYFNFKTDRNQNIGPKDFPGLENLIDRLLGSSDAKIVVPGADLIPPRIWISTLELPATEEQVTQALNDWTSESDVTSSLQLPSTWQIDYTAAITEDTIAAYLAAEFPFSMSRSQIESEIIQFLPDLDFKLSAPRNFKGTCFIKEERAPVALNSTITMFVGGLGESLKVTAIFMLNQEEGLYDQISTIESDEEGRRRRQVEEGSEGSSLPDVEFYFHGTGNDRLLPSRLQTFARRLTANPTFSNIESSNLIIEPLMFEVDRNIPTVEPETEPTTVAPLETLPEITVPPASTIPTKLADGEVVYTIDPFLGDNIKECQDKLENELESACSSEIERIDCGSNRTIRKDESSKSLVIKCSYKVDPEKERSDCMKITNSDQICNFKFNTTSILPWKNKCQDIFVNVCDPATSICKEEDNRVTCQCLEGHVKEVMTH